MTRSMPIAVHSAGGMSDYAAKNRSRSPGLAATTVVTPSNGVTPVRKCPPQGLADQ